MIKTTKKVLFGYGKELSIYKTDEDIIEPLDNRVLKDIDDYDVPEELKTVYKDVFFEEENGNVFYLAEDNEVGYGIVTEIVLDDYSPDKAADVMGFLNDKLDSLMVNYCVRYHHPANSKILAFAIVASYMVSKTDFRKICDICDTTSEMAKIF